MWTTLTRITGLRALDQQASYREGEAGMGKVAEEEEVRVEESFKSVIPAMSTKPTLTPREVYFTAVEEVTFFPSAALDRLKHHSDLG